MVESAQRPVFVLDELQMIKKVANAADGPLPDKLFNFMVRMTKETHLCHCMAVTSNSLFIPETSVAKGEISSIYRNFLIEQNLLFLDPVRGVVCHQSQLVRSAIKELTNMPS